MTNEKRTRVGLGAGTNWRNADVERYWVLRLPLALLMLVSALAPAWAEGGVKVSKPIGAVLVEPLPPEELSLSSRMGEWIITGPTFAYRGQNHRAHLTFCEPGRHCFG